VIAPEQGICGLVTSWTKEYWGLVAPLEMWMRPMDLYQTDGDASADGPPDDQNVGLASAPMFSPRTNECWAPDDLNLEQFGEFVQFLK
jgi:hypothetical protein